MAEPISFLIVDDHPVLRQGISAVLGTEFPGAKIAETSSYEEAIEAGSKSTPEVIIADPNIGGLDATSTVTKLRRSIEAPIVIFADKGDMRLLAQALKAGAKACVRKDSSVESLVEAITAAREQRFFIDPALAEGATYDGRDGDLTLTDRQREILQMFADGYHTEKVAETFGLSTETVRTHTKRILAKLNANTRTHAVAIAVRAQILD
jgi:DNA-binding NarL/FixJ family response regulator